MTQASYTRFPTAFGKDRSEAALPHLPEGGVGSAGARADCAPCGLLARCRADPRPQTDGAKPLGPVPRRLTGEREGRGLNPEGPLPAGRCAGDSTHSRSPPLSREPPAAGRPGSPRRAALLSLRRGGTPNPRGDGFQPPGQAVPTPPAASSSVHARRAAQPGAPVSAPAASQRRACPLPPAATLPGSRAAPLPRARPAALGPQHALPRAVWQPLRRSWTRSIRCHPRWTCSRCPGAHLATRSRAHRLAEAPSARPPQSSGPRVRGHAPGPLQASKAGQGFTQRPRWPVVPPSPGSTG